MIFKAIMLQKHCCTWIWLGSKKVNELAAKGWNPPIPANSFKKFLWLQPKRKRMCTCTTAFELKLLERNINTNMCPLNICIYVYTQGFSQSLSHASTEKLFQGVIPPTVQGSDVSGSSSSYPYCWWFRNPHSQPIYQLVRQIFLNHQQEAISVST